MKPLLGNLVFIHGRNHNGSLLHPGLITRILNDKSVNVIMFPDASSPYSLTSVPFVAGKSYQNEEALTEFGEGTSVSPVAYSFDCITGDPINLQAPEPKGASKAGTTGLGSIPRGENQDGKTGPSAAESARLDDEKEDGKPPAKTVTTHSQKTSRKRRE